MPKSIMYIIIHFSINYILVKQIFFRFLVLISGLELATNVATHFQVQLFVDWIFGLLGDEKENCKVSKIVQVIIAGNFFMAFINITNV